MSLPISKLMNLNLPLDGSQNKEIKTKSQKNEFPDRYDKLDFFKKPTNKNSIYELNEMDQFNMAMADNKYKNKSIQGLHLDIKSKVNPAYSFEGTDGWLDPGQRRRNTDPNSAPPYDYNFGSSYQKFSNDKDETVSHNNVALIQKAHESYYNWLNRYDVKPNTDKSITK